MATDKIVNGGLAIITNLLSGLGGTVPKYIGWGTNTTAAAVTDTDLGTAANESRTSGTVTRQTTTATNDTLQVAGTLTAGGSRAITEDGLFDAAGSGNPPSGGNLYQHDVFSVINLSTNDSIAFTIKSVFSCTS